MRRDPFDVPNISESLRRDYLAGKTTATEIALELARANLTPYILTEEEALERIGLAPEKAART